MRLSRQAGKREDPAEDSHGLCNQRAEMSAAVLSLFSPNKDRMSGDVVTREKDPKSHC